MKKTLALGFLALATNLVHATVSVSLAGSSFTQTPDVEISGSFTAIEDYFGDLIVAWELGTYLSKDHDSIAYPIINGSVTLINETSGASINVSHLHFDTDSSSTDDFSFVTGYNSVDPFYISGDVVSINGSGQIDLNSGIDLSDFQSGIVNQIATPSEIFGDLFIEGNYVNGQDRDIASSNLNLDISIVPEPKTFGLFLGIFIALFLRTRTNK